MNKTLTVLLDSCSDISFITEKTAEDLKLEVISQQDIPVSTLAMNETKFKSEKVRWTLQDQNNKNVSLDLHTIPQITETVTTPEISRENSEKINKITGVKLQEQYEIEEEPSILIGMDNFWKIVPKNFKSHTLHNDLVVIPTNISPIICQSTKTQYANKHMTDAIVRFDNDGNSSEDEKQELEISKPLKCFLTGMKIEKPKRTTKEVRRKIDDSIAWEKFNENISLENGRLSVLFPIKNNVQALDDNYGRSLGCLKGLLKQLENKPDLLAQYNETLREQLHSNILEFAPQESHPFLTYYMPHHYVLKLSSNTTKLRVVLNASSKGKNTESLNDILYQGEGIIPNIVGMLIRLRLCKNFIMGDIEKAFHQIELKTAHRDLTRILWIKDPKRGIAKNNLITLRHTRIPFGVNSSPFLLAASIIYFLKKEKSELNENITKNIYVDNIMLKVQNNEQCFKLYEEIKNLFSQISMNVREFYCTDKAILQQIPEKDKIKENNMKILGLQYKGDDDSFRITIPQWKKPKFTKTAILSYINSVFDPLGICQPIMLKAKLFLKKIHELKVDWLDVIEDQALQLEWENITDKIQNKEIRFKRQMMKNDNNKLEYLLFTDASKDVIAAVAYVAERENNSINHISFLNSKSSTMAEGTIPMKELSALVLGMRLLRENLKEINNTINDIRVYTDSQVVLHWLFKNPQKKVYIRNRIEKILKIKEEIEKYKAKVTFHYIKTEVNPADIPTRGVELEDEKFKIWREGPLWMKNDQSYNENIKTIEEIVNKEQEPVNKIINLFINSKRSPNYENIDKLVEQYSSFPKILRIIRFILAFITKSSKNVSSNTKLIEEFKNSKNRSTQNKIVEKFIIKMHQEQNVHYLSKKKYKCLDIVKDSYGILRVRGRIKDETRDNDNCPILLFGKTNYVKLFMNYLHSILLHANRNTMISIIRKDFCIINMKSVINTITSRCVKCQKLNNRPYKYPNYPVLPIERTKMFKPFENVGIDYAGPLYVTQQGNTSQSKVWIMLITCMCTRSVYLDLASDCSAKELMIMMRKFFARKRIPNSIISDNGSQFIKTDKIFNSFLNERNITWKFITPYSPWKGGFYEKMIGVTKKMLMKNLGKETVSQNELRALLCEVETIINNRPLTNIESGFDQVITPLSLEVYHPSNMKPSSLDSEKKTLIEDKNDVKQWMEKNNRIIRRVWEDWSSNYIEELRINQKRVENGKSYSKKIPLVGDLVLCVESNTKRNKWPLARVEQLIKSEDGNIRTVIIRNSENTTLRKSVNHLIPLELNQNKVETTDLKENERLATISQINSEQYTNLPKRTELNENLPIREELNNNKITTARTTVTEESIIDDRDNEYCIKVNTEEWKKDNGHQNKEKNSRGITGVWDNRLRDIPRKNYVTYF